MDRGGTRRANCVRCEPNIKDLSDIVPGDCVDSYVCDGCPLAIFYADGDSGRAFRLYGLQTFNGGCAEWAGNYLTTTVAIPPPMSGGGGGGNCSCSHCNGITNADGYLRCIERCENAC